ncbi:MAG: Na/Pi cotransporter family protein [Candidatus Dadabacteria bacterium]|nr:Na/Pi cotransporter family protein [Candidatus Dadabacteria bacterium]
MSTFQIVIQTAGGIGLFLLGMIVLTDGLRALAGSTMRSALMQFTKSPATGALTGAASTAVLQSSSATTVAAVGFVGAELLTFPQALGIIFGANIGTTFKGWLIAILGFKLNLISIFLPLVFIGAVLRLFTKGRLCSIGYSIAGFGLIFVGITAMQHSMSELHGFISFENLPADTLLSRLLLIGFGLVFSAVTQSSSAGVVATLTALYADLINFNQAAALVIGMDIGTTVTAAMATVGGSVGAKRTGFSHVFYNFLTATVALFLISPYTALWEYLAPGQIIKNAEIALVAFHTLFNTLGVVLILPFATQFAHFMERLIPEKISTYTQKLDYALLEEPSLAINAVQATIKNEILALFSHISAVLDNKGKGVKTDLDELQSAINYTQSYIDKINIESGSGVNWERLVNMIHTLDHLQRLLERCEEEEDRAITARDSAELGSESNMLISSLNEIISDIDTNHWSHAVWLGNDTSSKIHNQVKPFRQSVMSKVATGEYDVATGTAKLEAIRWLRRVSKHIARILGHFEIALLASGQKPEQRINQPGI